MVPLLRNDDDVALTGDDNLDCGREIGMKQVAPGRLSNNDQLPHDALLDRILSYVESDLGAMMTTGMNLSMRAILRSRGRTDPCERECKRPAPPGPQTNGPCFISAAA